MKVIYFDSWTQGIPYVQPVEQVFNKYGVITKFVHIESIVGKTLPENFRAMLCGNLSGEISGITSYDSKFFGKNITDFIDIESPDAILMISLSHIENRIITRYCQRKNIPVYYMMHGNLRTEAEDIQNLVALQGKANRFKVVKKLNKFIKYCGMIKEYKHASGSWAESLGLLVQIMNNPFSFLWNPKKHRSLNVDKAFVYEERHIKSMVDFFKLEAEKVYVTGDPKADDIHMNIRKDISNIGLPGDYALYLEQGLVDTGDITLQEQLKFIEKLGKELSGIGKSLVVKLHPRADLSMYSSQGNIFYFKNEVTLQTFIYHSDLVIGHFSTALNDALRLDKTILCASWFNDLRGTKFAEHPCVFTSEETFFSSLKNYDSLDCSDILNFAEGSASENIVRQIFPSASSEKICD